MRRSSAPVLIAAALTLAAVTAAPTTQRARAEHLLLVSIDGLRPEFYRDPGWPAPTLQQLATGGTSADGVQGVFPTVTYPSHTTMITGALPARHGIYYNTPFEEGGQTGRWYWEAELIRVPTLWDAVRDAGGTSASIAWPVSVGAPVDYNLPEIWSLEDGFGSVRPVRETDTPDGLLEELEREATGRLSDADLSADWLTREALSASMAAYLIETYRPTLTTVHLIGVDHFTHADGRDSPRVRRALAAADTALREMLDAIERAGLTESTAVIVTGDHGFSDIHTAVAPNVWLAQAGLRSDTPDRGDWRAAFHGASASAFLMLRDPDDAAALDQVREVLAHLPARERGLFRVVERDELDTIGADPRAALALTPMPGVTISSAASGAAVRAGGGATHGFFPEHDFIRTGFVGSGAGFRNGQRVPQMRLTHIAPLIAEILGLSLETPDGVLLPGLLERE